MEITPNKFYRSSKKRSLNEMTLSHSKRRCVQLGKSISPTSGGTDASSTSANDSENLSQISPISNLTVSQPLSKSDKSSTASNSRRYSLRLKNTHCQSGQENRPNLANLCSNSSELPLIKAISKPIEDDSRSEITLESSTVSNGSSDSEVSGFTRASFLQSKTNNPKEEILNEMLK